MSVSRLGQILPKHWLQAAAELDKAKAYLWTEYWLYIPELDKEYPFKEIVRKAFEFATGTTDDSEFFVSSPAYRRYIERTYHYIIRYKIKENLDFFTANDIDHFALHAHKPYRKNNQDNNKISKRLQHDIFTKTNAWAKALNLEGFITKEDNDWQRNAVFSHYSHAKIFRSSDERRKIFFTVGVDADERALVYKLHCYYSSRNPDNKLTNEQMKVFERLVDPTPARWQSIHVSELSEWNWERLIEKTKAFINFYMPLYDEVVEAVWDNSFLRPGKPGELREQPTPLGTGRLPERKKISYSQNADYESQAKWKKETGTGGEDLVIAFEKKLLSDAGRPDLADQVDRVPDYLGYDIISFFPDGRRKLVEVKTTISVATRPFHWSWNQYETACNNPESYWLYRLYNYNKENASADFFKISGNVVEQILVRPNSYDVFVK